MPVCMCKGLEVCKLKRTKGLNGLGRLAYRIATNVIIRGNRHVHNCNRVLQFLIP